MYICKYMYNFPVFFVSGLLDVLQQLSHAALIVVIILFFSLFFPLFFLGLLDVVQQLSHALEEAALTENDMRAVNAAMVLH